MRSVAVPVFSGSNELLGAINISTNAARVSMDTLMNRYLPKLLDSAAAIHRAVR
ncbi:IclR family transcriptional regulator domain-containing protein [Thalassolituus sp. UBA6592]|uniref:IclR family transcriptional regulator domain-containing protein n=1 Tax=Thalassolituus sp. UBA6592 TaxID=1947665 RepID=UPI0032E48337